MHYSLFGRVSVEIESDWLKNPESVFLTLFDGNDFLSENDLSMGNGSLWSEKEFLKIQALPLAREPLDAAGGFQIHIDDRQHFYEGGQLFGLLEVTMMPDADPSQVQSSYLVLGEFGPAWRASSQGKIANFHATILADQWMQLLMQQDIYCLSGQVRHAGSMGEVLGAMVVIETMQTVQHQQLSQVQTDPFGRFSIWLNGRQLSSLLSQHDRPESLPLMLSIGAQQEIVVLDLSAQQRAWHINIEYAAQDTAITFNEVKWKDLTDLPSKEETSAPDDTSFNPMAKLGHASPVWQYEFPKINLHGSRVGDQRRPSGKAQLWQ